MSRVTVMLQDDALVTSRLRGVGYRAVSTGGWRGPVRKVRHDAAADVYEYRSTLTPSAPRGEDVPPSGATEASGVG